MVSVSGSQTLAPGAVATFSGTYTLTQADTDGWRVDNVATAVGTAPDSSTVESAPARSTVTLPGAPTISLIKTGQWIDTDGDGMVEAGERVEFTFLVENTSSENLVAVTVDDPMAAVSEAPQNVNSGASATFTASYTLTQSDIDAGELHNTASAAGNLPNGDETVSLPAEASLAIPAVPGMSISKQGTLIDANGNGVADPGEEIEYTFTIENTGNVTLTDIVLDDPELAISGGPIPSLAPGESDSSTFSATYTVTQDDVDNGEIVSPPSKGEGTAPDGSKHETDSHDGSGTPGTPTVIPVDQTVLKLAKSADWVDGDGDGVMEAGETVTFTFTVENTGDETATNVTVEDPMVTINEAAQSLAAGATATFTASYVLTQADVDAGELVNIASGAGNLPNGDETVSLPAEASLAIPAVPGMSISKQGTLIDANGNGVADPGEEIEYTFTIENTGNVTLTDIVLDDPELAISGGPIPSLAPGESDSATFSATYTVTQDDVDNGEIVSPPSKGEGTAPDGSKHETDSHDGSGTPGTPTVIPVDQTVLKLAKSADWVDGDGDGVMEAGETVTFTFTVENTGDETATNVTVDDPMVTINEAAQSLAAGASATFTASYVLTQADVDAGELVNTASAAGNLPNGDETVSLPAEASLAIPAVPGMSISKQGTLIDANGNGVADPGEEIEYTFTIENTGNVTLTDIVLDDPELAISGGPIPSLAPGESDSATFSATYTVTQDDVDAGEIVSPPSKGEGTAPDGSKHETDSHDGSGNSGDSTVIPVEKRAALAVIKTGEWNDANGNGMADAGEVIEYTFAIQNTGNVTLMNVSPVDNGPVFGGKVAAGTLSAFSPGPVALATGESRTFNATYTLAQADIDAAAGLNGGVSNTARAQGTDASGSIVQSDESTVQISLPASEPINVALAKKSVLKFVRRGDRAPFAITARNASPTNAGLVTITDVMPAGFRYVEGTAKVNGVTFTPTVNGNKIVFSDLDLGPQGSIEIQLSLQALASAGAGEHVNQAVIEDDNGEMLAPIATAAVEILADSTFDCGDIIGTVFDDLNGNGYQDVGEPGLPNVRVATAKGWLINTDRHGRFHVPCAALPDARIGSNFIMKLDPRTLPTGYQVTTENPRVVRLSAGKMTQVNFGASLGREVRLDLAPEAFLPGTVELSREWAAELDHLMAVLSDRRSSLLLTYRGTGPDGTMAERRIRNVETLIAERWRQKKGDYPLNIKTRIEAGY